MLPENLDRWMINFPNAKINIGLNITEKRTDGFHNIESVFYPIGWKDALEVADSESFRFVSTGLKISGSKEDNLILKAYNLLKPYLPTEKSIAIHLHKAIPMGAGLGGGSSDGAFALKLLNDFFQLDLTTETLEDLAGKMGSDCPFFIQNKPVFCYDRGIKFKNIELDLSSYFVVLVNPNIHISTAEAYTSVIPGNPKNPLMELIKKPMEEWSNFIFNDFENPLTNKYPIIGKIKEQLYEKGAKYAAITGSGSTVYGIFEQKIDLKNTFNDLSIWQGQML